MEKKNIIKQPEKKETTKNNEKEKRTSKLKANKKRKNRLLNHYNKHKKVYNITLLALISLLVIALGYIGIRNFIINKKYAKYEEKMELYGYDDLYFNKSAKSSQKLTKAEMVKIIIASIYNATEVESRGFNSKGEFESDEWSDLAMAFEIIDKNYISKENYDDNVSMLECLEVYLNARSKLLEIPIASQKESSFKNLQEYTLNERRYIDEAAQSGLIENSNKKIKLTNDLNKGEFNKLVITFVEKYNTVAPENETLVLKEESKPENANIYPYILYSVDKATYEYKGINEGGRDYKTPAETYKYRKDYYSQVKYRTELYYNALLNVDYETIDGETFLNSINEYSRYDYTEQINKYVDYVKENKIQIEGKATVQFPIFYLDGTRYRARVKLEFEIKNSDTDKNLLLADLTRNTEVTYKNKQYEIYVDVPMGTTLMSNSLFLDMEPIIDLIVNDTQASKLNEL